MKTGHGTGPGAYFRQLAMPLHSPLPVLRPVRRWPVRPGEERVRPEKISMPETTRSSSAMKQSLPQLGPTSSLGGPQEPTSDETKTFRAEAPRPSAPPEIVAPSSTERADSHAQNQPLYKDTTENPGRRSGETFGGISPGEATPSSATWTSSIVPEILSTKSEQIAEKSLGEVSSQLVDASARRSRSETARVLESSSKPVYETNAADDAGNRPLEFPFEDETRLSAPHRMSARQDKIEIGRIEVRIVNPSPALPVAAPTATTRLRPLAGGTASSSGSLARGLRGPWGLRQG